MKNKLILALLFIALLSGCTVQNQIEEETKLTQDFTQTQPLKTNAVAELTETEGTVGGDLQTAPVVFDMGYSYDSSIEGLTWETYYSYEDITYEAIAEAMTNMSGLDFFVTFNETDDAFYVDWSLDSTLIANLDDRVQNEDYFFFDADSMRWFMMDSMMRTLNENGVSEVYYTMDGGKELVFDELYPINKFPIDIPYMGSEFYKAHLDVQGDASEAIDILWVALGDKMDGRILIGTGSEEIDGVMCETFALGTDHTENFVAEEHFAISPNEIIYTIDIISGAEWVIYEP